MPTIPLDLNRTAAEASTNPARSTRAPATLSPKPGKAPELV